MKPTLVENTKIDPATLAKAIAEISLAMRKLLASGLNRKAIVILIHDQSRIGKREIEIILNNLEALAQDYTS